MTLHPISSLSLYSLLHRTKLCLVKAKGMAPNAMCSSRTLAHCFLSRFSQLLRSIPRQAHLGYPHLGSAFTLLLRRVWMLSTYCLGAWGAHDWEGLQVCRIFLLSCSS